MVKHLGYYLAMDSAQLNELKALFSEAVELDEPGRRDLIERVSRRDRELADQLRDLLTHDAPTGDCLVDAVNSVAADVGTEANQSRIGQSMGPYRIIEQIGQGGMGAVYRAERSDGEFEHQVAIKLIGTHAFSPDLIERFRNERQILARLNHPFIASILDGGTTDAGITYLVMELIDGLPVIDYCRVHRLTIRQRLKLFLQICDAIEFAHRNLVVHRDIKPSNILVTGDGTPKLLDFGIAKFLEPGGSTHISEPATVIAITPDYSSPEQILGLPVTTSCDVYSLGVLLFEMLSGARPYQRQGKRLSEIEDEIRNTAPVKPSVALQRAQANRSAAISHSARTLSGDLDTITIAALRREAEDRYKSVNALSSDIRAYLAGQPIAAKGRSFGYVAKKFLYRNRWPASLAAVLIATVTAATAFHIERIGAERDRVAHEARKSAAVTKYLENLFEITGPNETNGEEISARDVLDRGTRRLDAELADQPEIRARLLTSIGAVYENLGFVDEGIETTIKAIEIQHPADGSTFLLRSLASLAQMYRTRGDYESTRRTLEQATALADRVGGKESEDYAWVLFEFGELHLMEGNFEQALGYNKQTKELLDRLPDHDPDFHVSVMATTGKVYQFLGNHVSSEAFMREALAEIDRLDYEIPVERATISHNLATLLHELGRHAEAEPLYLQAYDIESRVLGEDHFVSDVLATNLGRLYRDMGQYDSATVYLQKAIDHARKLHGDDHFFTAYNTKNLADLLRDTQDYTRADELYEQVVANYRNTLEQDHPYMASALLGRAKLLVLTDQHGQAAETAREALRICRLSLDEDHWLTATTKSTLAEALLNQDTIPEAETLLIEAWDALLPSRPGHETTLKVANQLAALYRSINDSKKSRYYTEQAQQLARN